MPKPELISSKTCPYAQRTAIMLHEKRVDFVTTYIDLQNKPDWFLDISPLGKIPILRIEDNVLFESAIINEYLDETHPPHMHPPTPLQRALNRAWVEFSSDLFMHLVHMVRANEEAQFSLQKRALEQKLARLNHALAYQPFFNGDLFSLVDVAYAPLFIRMAELEKYARITFLQNLPKLQAWGKHLLQRDSVQASLPADFTSAFLAGIQRPGSYFVEHWFSPQV